MKMIKVYSEGQVYAKPNLIEVYIDFNIENSDYSCLIQEGDSKLKKLINTLDTLNIKRKLDTIAYNISTKSENIKDEYNQYHMKNVGFVLNHNLKLNISFDLKLLSALINAICNENIEPLINIKFSLKNKDIYIKKARELAVKNAIKEGNDLAMYSNVEIKEISIIEYRSENDTFHSKTNYSPMLMRSTMDFTTINPIDLKFSQGVTITFELK